MKQNLSTYRFSDARNALTAVMDAAQAYHPQRIVKRKSSEDDVIVISATLLQAALGEMGKSKFRVMTTREDDGSWTVVLSPFDLAVNAPTKEEASRALLRDVRLYVEEYLGNAFLYLRSPNRRHHLPQVMQAYLASSDDELSKIIRVAPLP